MANSWLLVSMRSLELIAHCSLRHLGSPGHLGLQRISSIYSVNVNSISPIPAVTNTTGWVLDFKACLRGVWQKSQSQSRWSHLTLPKLSLSKLDQLWPKLSCALGGRPSPTASASSLDTLNGRTILSTLSALTLWQRGCV